MATYSSRHHGLSVVVPAGTIKFTLHTTTGTADGDLPLKRPMDLGSLIVAIKKHFDIPGDVNDLVVTTK
ncbi:hypothetical protein [Kitasatospora sp. NPDC056731]|uniref:hypothetical protein n=1 Tax=Kitasatospora sp. NPDC056731 TaxID=3155422 RepID=UPI00343EE316